MKHSEVRNTIVRTASNLFYEQGYNLTGINEIIAEAGIAKATLYNHFSSKEDICVAYIQYKNQVFLHEIGLYCYAKPKGDKQILGIFDFLQQFFKGDGFHGCWCLNTVSEIPSDNQKILVEIQKEKREFLKFIEKLIAANREGMEEKQAESLAKQIYLLYEGAVAESHLYKQDWPIKMAKHMATQSLK
ncbi:TetR/AcrR family transcriptional regulator [Aureisphaera galaxeae]|uniref:TetR/AcrR family transcriptional regulator n=1 Tax=Aureisphaera galaxeae TaxID=1538023 RepID=UPI00235050AF|nr:TetR/AcrR family transcriptional regulator [Aureisphaera galaxeae]MDC8005333.1 TetR/AcrR family transcriptional regulator [Aureisphaera galaxeae]